MPSIPSHLGRLAGAGLLALLAACGGGGSGSGTLGSGTTDSTTGGTDGSTTVSADVVDKYVGTWRSSCSPDGSGSHREDLRFTKASATSINFSFTGTSFGSTDCSGAAGTSESGSGSASFVGTKTIGSETVDKIDIVENGQTEKSVVIVRSDGKLYFGVEPGDPGATFDAQGYPNALDSDGSTKVS